MVHFDTNDLLYDSNLCQLFLSTLLKIKVLQKVLHIDTIEEPFVVPQRTIQSKVL